MHLKILSLFVLFICIQANGTQQPLKQEQLKKVLQDSNVQLPSKFDMGIATKNLEQHMRTQAHLCRNNESGNAQINRGQQRTRNGKP